MRSTIRAGSGVFPTVKYVVKGTVIFPSRSCVTLVSSASAPKRLPVIMAKEKLFLLCSVASFWKAASSLPSRLPSTMLLNSEPVKIGGNERSRYAYTLAAIATSRV